MGLKNSDPRLHQILAVVRSREGLIAAVLSTSQGRPALEGVDQLLQTAMGTDYTRDDGVTNEAAFRVFEQMKEMGFIVIGSDDLRPGCIAGRAKIFVMPDQFSSRDGKG